MKFIKATLCDSDFLSLLRSTDEEAVSAAKFIIRLNLLQDMHRSLKKWNMKLELTNELEDALINVIDASVDDYLKKSSL